MHEPSTIVGLDVHRNTISFCVLKAEEPEPWNGQISNQPAQVRKLAQRIKAQALGPVRCRYEAGPCCYGLHRDLIAQDFECTVIAPSLTPSRPGDRIRTDRRDARKLAVLFRAGLLTEVHPPSVDEEAVRDLCRCRDDARRRFRRIEDRGKHRNKIVIARELAGFPWAALARPEVVATQG